MYQSVVDVLCSIWIGVFSHVPQESAVDPAVLVHLVHFVVDGDGDGTCLFHRPFLLLSLCGQPLPLDDPHGWCLADRFIVD